MIFKHGKFEDSVTMRSLEKLAKEKNLVQDKPVLKTASKNNKSTDLSITSNLTNNILKLSSGLKQLGYADYANELEKNYINYKQANSLYNVHKEDGDDLIHSAHPKGSHKLEGVDGDAVVETVLDQHAKLVSIVNKNPSVKLSSSAEVINAVKLVLAVASAPEIKNLLNESYDLAAQARDVAFKVGNLSFVVKSWVNSRIEAIKENVDAFNMTGEPIDDIVSSINALKRNFTPNLLHNLLPEFLNKGLTDDDVYKKVNGILQNSLTKAKEAKKALLEYHTTGNKTEEKAVLETPQKTNSDIELLIKTYNDALKNIVRYKAEVEAKEIPESKTIISWLDNASAIIKNKLDKFNSYDPATKESVAKILLDKFNNEIQPKLDAVKNKWSL